MRSLLRGCLFFVGISSSALLAVSLCISVLATAPLPAGRRGPFMSLRQSLESDTGVNYHSLAKRFPARLQTRSSPNPLSPSRVPPSHAPLATTFQRQFFIKWNKVYLLYCYSNINGLTNNTQTCIHGFWWINSGSKKIALLAVLTLNPTRKDHDKCLCFVSAFRSIYQFS